MLQKWKESMIALLEKLRYQYVENSKIPWKKLISVPHRLTSLIAQYQRSWI